MKIFCTASSDAYITDKIINQSFRADDANTGKAGTLDLYKLYDETLLSGSDKQNELSRILVKFDLGKVRSLFPDVIDTRSSRFKAEIKLFDVQTGFSSPSNFSVIAYPLSQSFDEGVGKNISGFTDLGVVNFLTASIVNGHPQAWYASGANRVGGLNTNPIDIISSGTIGGTEYQFFGTQYFKEGNEDLVINVTNAVSGVLSNDLPDLGFRISFSGSDESDKKTRFVKRFATRHSSNPHLRPRLEISFDDSIIDHRGNFYFDTTGSIFLRNSRRSENKNFIVNGTELNADDSLTVKLVKGSFSKIFEGSQHRAGSENSGVEGIYSSSFSLSVDDQEEYEPGKKLSDLIASERKVEFKEYWSFGNKGLHTGSIVIKSDETQDRFRDDNIEIYSINCKLSYDSKDRERIDLFGVNHTEDEELPRKRSIKKTSKIFQTVHYRVLDADSHKMIFDFDEVNHSTRVSSDVSGMYFNFHFDVLPVGRAYVFEYLVSHNGMRKVIRDDRTRFTVV